MGSSSSVSVVNARPTLCRSSKSAPSRYSASQKSLIRKLNRIKKALYDILGDEVQTEKAFAIIAKEKYHVSFEAETPERQPDSLSFHFGKDKGDEWVSESDIVHDFALAHPDCSFALGNAVLEYLDEKQHSERNIPELKAGWYKKTDLCKDSPLETFDIEAYMKGLRSKTMLHS